MLTIVVLGASAGGLEPLRAFFRAADANPDVAFVVITHLPANRDSHLVGLLGNVGTVPVRAADDGQRAEGGAAYVLPPGMLMGIREGHFALERSPVGRPAAKPIDFFMSALAEDAPERCVGIVLSGSDHDGTAGLKAIKAAGGLTLVQAPETAEFQGMPCSAIESGVADQVLATDAMPAAIRDYLGHEPLDFGELEQPDSAFTASNETLDGVLRTIYMRTGHDFRCYRPAMLRRRLRRRMGLNGLDRVHDYLDLLKQSDEEADALKREFLIGVTDFFRDPEAWRELESAVQPLLAARCGTDDEPLRVWTPGCATGEESYSIAMLLLEQLAPRADGVRVQVFGTDIDLDALAIARAGAYPASSLANVSPERLARFFEHQGNRYVARPALRDAILFAPHNLIRDTPYSKLDLVLCRNVLIYFQPELQQRVFELFHFALRPGGFLLLGKAESVGAQSALFEPASRTIRLYRRVGGRSHLPPGFGRAAGPATGATRVARPNPNRLASADETLQAALAGRTVDAAVLVDDSGRAIQFHGDAQRFVRHDGPATLDLISLVRPALRVRLRRALREALSDRRGSVQSVMLDAGGATGRVRVDVEPVVGPDERRLALVLFDAHHALPDPAAAGTTPTADAAGGVQAEADAEEAARELAIALDEAERSNEDLRVANEESLSLNEELQSSNEELESSKEELQSLNEELATVNAQLEEKLQELARTNDDLTNLLTSSRVPTVLLDRERRVRRFTPSASEIFGLKTGDEGRLLGDIASRVVDRTFERDLELLEGSDAARDAEIAGADGKCYLRRLLPYRGADGSRAGAVATYLDVTALRTASRRLIELVAVLQDSNDAVIVYDLDGHVLECNDGASRAYGYRRDELVGHSMFDIVPKDAHVELRRQIEVARSAGHAGPADGRRRLRDGTILTVSVTLSALRDTRGTVYALLSTERDITARLVAEKEMYFRRLADLIPAFLRVDNEHGRAEFVNQAGADFTGLAREALLDEGWLDLMSPEDRPGYLAAFASALASRSQLNVDYRWRRADGAYRWMRSVSVPRFHESGAFAGYVALATDVEDRRRAEDALLHADRRKDEYLAMLAHELRNPLAPIRNAVAVLAGRVAHDADASWATGIIARQSDHLARLLEDLLDVARIARGKLTLDVRPVDIGVVIERAVETCGPLIESRRQQLTRHLPTEPLRVEGDLLRLTQVVTNLLNNASKYTQRGGNIRIDVERAGAMVVVRVSDDGAGISAEMLPRVFDLFAQADRTLDRAKGGLGLGLTLVRRLVELHHGTVEAFSVGLGEGSEFVLRLPLLATATSEVATPAAVAPRAAHSRRVLVADDNVDAAESLAMVLRMDGHEVRTVHDAKAALEEAERNPPEVVVLDIGLPDADGCDVARSLRARSGTAGALLIAVTGYGQPDDIARSIAAGFDHHLVKPTDPDRIAALIAALAPKSGRDSAPSEPLS